MKNILFLIISLFLAGCQRQSNNTSTTVSTEKFHWALVDKQKIDVAIFMWSRAKLEDAKRTEALTPDVEEKIGRYDSLNARLSQKRMEQMMIRPPSRMPLPPRRGESVTPEKPTPSLAEQEFETLSNQVAEAKAPVAEIVDRRERQTAELREQYKTDKLITEYAKGRFELVVDGGMGHSPVMYQAMGDVVDITESILNLFREKTKS